MKRMSPEGCQSERHRGWAAFTLSQMPDCRAEAPWQNDAPPAVDIQQ